MKTLVKYQKCGCVICTCEDEKQCQGCGAKNCGMHPIGQIPNPIYFIEINEEKYWEMKDYLENIMLPDLKNGVFRDNDGGKITVDCAITNIEEVLKGA